MLAFYRQNNHFFKTTVMSNLKEKITHFITFKVANRILMWLGSLMSPFSKLPNDPILANKDFPWSNLLEDNWQYIRSEVQVLLEKQKDLPNIQDIQPAESLLTTDNHWKTFFLQGFGHKAERNRELCPYTAKVLDQIPGLLTAFFSILHPGKHIPAHKGIFKGIVRTHLGLVIPETGECMMRVDKAFIHWKPGKVVFFDDTFNHEVWNNTDSIRIFLLIDTIRPYKFNFIKKINQYIIDGISNSLYVKEALKKNEDWEKVYYEVLA
jgi:aspartyl/asparaginyl beta-hydroxylase (cupin superfamily)